MNTFNQLDPPEKSAFDSAHAATRSILGAVPVLGQTFVEIFSSMIIPPLEKRRNEWMQEVSEILSYITTEGCINIEELQKNESFIDMLLHISQIAIKTHQKEKLNALRNALINSALPNPPEESIQWIFINWVDEFSIWHLRILKLFQNPPKWFEEKNLSFPDSQGGGQLLKILKKAFVELSLEHVLYNQIWKDLWQKGLVNIDSLNSRTTEKGLTESHTTEIGNLFLRFIENIKT